MKAWLLLLVSLLAVGCGCDEIEAGHVGVVKKWREPVGTVGPGMHWTGPGTDIDPIDTRATVLAVKAAASSKDLQRVSAEVSVQYAISGVQVLAMLQKIGDGASVNALISPAVQESIKAVTAGYTAEELVTKREEVKVKIDNAIRGFVSDMLKSRDVPNLIEIINVAITDFDFSKEFNDSIEAKVKAEQDSLRATNEKTKRITDAEAKAASDKLEADAVAYSVEVKSKAKADAIKRETDSLRGNQDYIQMRLIEEWDGKLPVYQGQSQSWIQLPGAK